MHRDLKNRIQLHKSRKHCLPVYAKTTASSAISFVINNLNEVTETNTHKNIKVNATCKNENTLIIPKAARGLFIFCESLQDNWLYFHANCVMRV